MRQWDDPLSFKEFNSRDSSAGITVAEGYREEWIPYAKEPPPTPISVNIVPGRGVFTGPIDLGSASVEGVSVSDGAKYLSSVATFGDELCKLLQDRLEEMLPENAAPAVTLYYGGKGMTPFIVPLAVRLQWPGWLSAEGDFVTDPVTTAVAFFRVGAAEPLPADPSRWDTLPGFTCRVQLSSESKLGHEIFTATEWSVVRKILGRGFALMK